MNKKKLTALAVSSALGLGALTAAVLPVALDATAYELTMGLFHSRGVKMEECATLSGSSEYSDVRGGLRIKGEAGGQVRFENVLAGAFDMEFIPESGLSGVTVTFTEETTGESFDVVTSFGSSNVSAYVEAEGEKAGLYYFATKGLNETTAIYNSVGLYTQYVNDFTAISLSFDPETMTVKIGDYVVWSLKSKSSDGRSVSFAYDCFETYFVSMELTQTVGEGSMLLYEVNSQPLDRTVILPSAAPRLFADFAYEGVVGEKYSLPKVNAYDLADGLIDPSDATVTVKKGSTNVTVTDGAFTPTEAGEYLVYYTVANEAGISSTQKYSLQVNESFDGEVVFEEKLPEGTLGKNTLVYFPTAAYQNAAISSLAEVELTATVYKGEEAVKTVKNAEDGFTHVFGETGDFKVVYAPVHEYYGKDVFEVTFTVTEEAGYSLSSAWKNAYTTSDVVELPIMTVHTANGDLTATSSVRFPDGSVYSNTRFKPTIAGEYVVTYTAKDGEESYAFALTFEATTDPAALFTTNGNVTMTNGAFSYNDAIKGLVVETELGSTLTYNNTINLNDYAYKTQVEGALLFELMLDPYTAFYADLVSMDVVLTDKYDPDNYVTITITSLWESKNTTWACVRAGYAGSPSIGLEGEATMENDYVSGNIHINQAGFLYNGSMSATPNSGTAKSLITTKVYFDYEERAVYAVFDTLGYKNEYVSRRALVADLDHKDYFTSPWEGFTTGECTLTINPNSYTGTKARFVVCGVDGQDFTGGAYADKKAPALKVDTGEGEIPCGVVGVEYPLFDATAVDGLIGVVDVEKRVYYTYHGKAYDVAVTGNSFLPEYAGEYEIVYSARDRSGNVAERTIAVTVQPENYYESSPMGVRLEEDYVAAVKTGERVFVAAVEEIFGGAGRVTCDVSVTDGNGNTVDVSGGVFRPLTAGEYTVTYALKDYLSQTATQSYAVTVAAHDGVVFKTEELVLPTAILTGIEYDLPLLEAVDFGGGSAQFKTTTLTVTDQNGKKIEAKDGVFVVTDRAVESVTLTYACPDTDAKESYTLPVKMTTDENGLINFDSYFYGVNAAVSQGDEGISLKTSAAGSSVEFLREILAETFSFTLDVDTGTTGSLKTFSVLVYEGGDKSKCIRFTISRDGDGALVSVNGEKQTVIAGSFTGVSGYSLGLAYRGYEKSFIDKEGNQLAVLKTWENGAPFEGFTSKTARVKIVFEELEGEAGLIIKQINKQSFLASSRADTVGADSIYSETVGGNYSVGDVVTVWVLSVDKAKKRISLTMKKPN